MQFTNRQMQFAWQAAIVLALGVFLAMAGPFGTYGDLAPWPRYAYWVGLCLFGYGSIVIAAQALRALRRTAGAVAIGTVALASALPTTFAVAWAEQLLRLDHAVPLHAMPRVYGSVAAIQLLMLLLLTRMRLSLEPLLFARHALPQPPATPPPPAPPEPPQADFLARSAPQLGGRLLALQAEDHYLRVITDAGSALVLMRLADAVREVPPADGMQVHRSWWVGYCAVKSIRKEPGRISLGLADGTLVPVSRTYQAAVKAAHWPELA